MAYVGRIRSGQEGAETSHHVDAQGMVAIHTRFSGACFSPNHGEICTSAPILLPDSHGKGSLPGSSPERCGPASPGAATPWQFPTHICKGQHSMIPFFHCQFSNCYLQSCPLAIPCQCHAAERGQSVLPGDWLTQEHRPASPCCSMLIWGHCCCRGEQTHCLLHGPVNSCPLFCQQGC